VLRAHAFAAEADACFTQAERLDPDEPRWPYFRGLRLFLIDTAASLPLLRRAADLCDQHDPANTAPHLLAAEGHLELGQYDEARELCQRVLKRQPNNPLVQFDLGLLALAQDDLPGALRHFTRCAGSPFTRKRTAYQLATLYQRQGGARTAAEFTRRAQQSPDDLPAADPYVLECQRLDVSRHTQLTRLGEFEREGQLDRSIPALRRLADESPDDHFQVALGIALIKFGDFSAAEHVLRGVTRQAPDKVRAHYFLSLALYQQAEQLRARPGQRPHALELYRAAAASARQATALQPDHAFAYINLGLSLKYLGQRSEALAALRQAQRCRPELADPHLYLAEALGEEGQELAALRVLQQAILVAAPEDHRAALAFARIWIQVSLRKLLG
jgi:tetratricopeptide (TPR) repeat protein